MDDTCPPPTSTSASATSARATYHDAVLHAHLLAVTRADALSLSIRRGAATATSAGDAAALFSDVTYRMARRLASRYPVVAYAMTLLPQDYWRAKR